MSLAGPPPVSTNPILRLAGDFRAERSVAIPFPPGDTRPSLRRTQGFANHPLPLLLDAYERYGPVFTLRIFHGNVVFMLGPEANHFITVSHADHFTWRDGHMGDLPPLQVDGSGAAKKPVTAPRLKLGDVKNKALVIHAGGDNHADQPKPNGGGGERIACGVIEPQKKR